MFSLIVVIIAIALVAALAAATIYYGGQAFRKSGATQGRAGGRVQSGSVAQRPRGEAAQLERGAMPAPRPAMSGALVTGRTA